jgi:hypothetical protein
MAETNLTGEQQSTLDRARPRLKHVDNNIRTLSQRKIVPTSLTTHGRHGAFDTLCDRQGSLLGGKQQELPMGQT